MILVGNMITVTMIMAVNLGLTLTTYFLKIYVFFTKYLASNIQDRCQICQRCLPSYSKCHKTQKICMNKPLCDYFQEYSENIKICRFHKKVAKVPQKIYFSIFLSYFFTKLFLRHVANIFMQFFVHKHSISIFQIALNKKNQQNPC